MNKYKNKSKEEKEAELAFLFEQVTRDYSRMDFFAATYTFEKHIALSSGRYEVCGSALKYIYRRIYKPIDKFFFHSASNRYGKRVLFLPAFERGKGKTQSPHVHMLIGAPKGRMPVEETLQFLSHLATPKRSEWIREQHNCQYIPTLQDALKWESYILKNQYRLGKVLDHYRTPSF